MLYTIKNFLLTSRKLLTNFENAYRNPPQYSLQWDLAMFPSVDPSLAAWKLRQNLQVTQAAFSRILMINKNASYLPQAD
jgi:hypothetical protein